MLESFKLLSKLRLRTTIISITLLIGIAHSSNAYSGQVTLDDNNVRWSRLEFGTSILFISIDADVKYSKINSSEVTPKLLEKQDTKLLMPKNEQTLLLTMNSDNFGRKSLVDFWFEADLTGLQIKQIETGRKNYIRTYRFGTNGVYRQDLFPHEDEKNKPWQEWTKAEYHNYPHPDGFNTTQLTNNAAIFYIASAANLKKPGDSFKFYTFGKKHLNQIELKVEELSEIEVDYYVQDANGKRNIYDEEKDALRISITPTPVGENITENEFQFLGLKEDIKVYIDPKTRIPLQISSRIAVYGAVNVTLNHVDLM